MSRVIAEHTVGRRRMRLVQGDITLADTDAIVNAANCALAHGGGVAGAIVRRGGEQIQRESDRIGHCPEGQAVVTGAGRLPARYVIHAVGPRGSDPQGDAKLAGAINSSLQRATELGLASLAIPAVSAGIFGFPRDRCARILLETVEAQLSADAGGSLERVDFVVLDDLTAQAFTEAWHARWGAEGMGADLGP